MSEEIPEEGDNGSLQTLRRSTRGRISLVWAIPIVAVVLGASLVLQTYLGKGPTIEIEFPVAAGIEPDATPIKLLDVEIGVVVEVRLNDRRDGVVAVAELDPSSEAYLTEGTVFWLVKPRVSLAGISGIETLLSGQYIEVVPSEGGAYRTSFVGQLSPPVRARYPNGKSIVLETHRLGSITDGTPVYHRGLRAGEVERYELPEGAEGNEPIRISVVIDEAFATRVRESTLFWNGSGIDARVSLDGVEIRTEGLAAMLLAGIAFTTPDTSAFAAPEAAPGTVFTLYDGANAARESRLQRESLALRLESRDGTGLPAGTLIHYRGIKIGKLGDSQLTPDAQAVRIDAFIEPRFQALIRERTRFFKSSGIDVVLGLDGVRVRAESLRTVALGGVSIAVPKAAGAAVESGAVFALYEEPQDSWLRWKPSIALDGHTDETAVEHRLPPEPNAGSLELTLVSQEAGGLSAGSPVSYRSVPVGRVIGSSLRDAGDEAGESVEIRIRIDAAHRRLVGSDTRFFRATAFRMDLGLSGLEVDVGSLRELALGGVAFGNPAGLGERARWGDRFPLYSDGEAAVADLREAEFLRVTVEAHESTLREGAPVYFRRHAIGEVCGSTLTADAQAVRVELGIERSYASLVRENTRFWSPDAVNIQASLAGVEVHAAPIRALLAGGVMLATPNEEQAEAQAGAVFRLESSAPAGWEHWHPDLPLQTGAKAEFAADPAELRAIQMVLVATNVDAIGEGDPIFYRGLQIGSLGVSTLASDGKSVLIDALIAPEYGAVIRANMQFWNASGFEVDLGWGGVETTAGPLETLVRGGVQVATPDPAGDRAQSGDRFVLRPEPEEGWQEWAPVLR